MDEQQIISGSRVKVKSAISCIAEPYIGKTGTVIRQGEGYMESHFFVKLDESEEKKEIAFYAVELQLI